MNGKIFCTFLVIGAFFAFLSPVNAADPAYLIKVKETSFLPETIYNGDIVNLRVDIENRGSTNLIEDLNACIDIGNNFDAVEVNKSVESIKPNSSQSLVFKFKVKEDTLPGYYSLVLTMDYVRSENKAVQEQSESILIAVSKSEKNLDVTIEPRVINPGKQTEMIFTLKNVSGTSVSNISFSWEESNDLVLPLGSDNKRYVSFLGTGSDTEISYIVAADPNIEPGIYSLDITMTFTEVSGTKTQESEVGLIVGGGTEFEVSAEMSGSNQITISIANVGSNNAGAVVVRIPEQEGVKVSGSNVSILGNLNEGDYTLANFSVSGGATGGFSGTAQGMRQGFRGTPAGTPPVAEQSIESPPGESVGSRKVTVEIEYTDTTGERQVIKKTVEIDFDITSMQSSFSEAMQSDSFDITDYALYIAAGVIAVAAIVYYKKRKK